MEKVRIEWIDIAKGLGMILVIMGHAYVPEYFNKYLLSFHMPLFFFISGYFFKSNKYSNTKQYIFNKSRTLLIPYFVFAIAMYLEGAIIGKGILGKFENVSYIKSFIGIFYSNNIENFMPFNGTLWFITCLFVVETIFYILNKNIKEKKYVMLALMLFAVLSYLDSKYMPIRLPWGIDIALTGVVFYGLGNLLKRHINNIYKVETNIKIVLIVISLAVSIAFSYKNEIVFMYDNKYGNFLYFYTAALSGLITVILIAMVIRNSKFISFIGKHTFIILAVHTKVILYAGAIIKVRLDVEIYGSWFWSIILTILSLACSVPFIYVINQYFPFVLGKRISEFKTQKI